MRAVVDPNVLISGLLSSVGSSARILAAFAQGEVEIVTSPALVAELERALAYPRLRNRIPAADAAAFVAWLAAGAESHEDPADPPSVRSQDPGDDYLIALAEAHRVPLASGGKHLLELAERLPVLGPAEFVELLASWSARAGATGS